MVRVVLFVSIAIGGSVMSVYLPANDSQYLFGVAVGCLLGMTRGENKDEICKTRSGDYWGS